MNVGPGLFVRDEHRGSPRSCLISSLRGTTDHLCEEVCRSVQRRKELAFPQASRPTRQAFCVLIPNDCHQRVGCNKAKPHFTGWSLHTAQCPAVIAPYGALAGGPPSGRMTERGSPYAAQRNTGNLVASSPRIPLRSIQATLAVNHRLTTSNCRATMAFTRQNMKRANAEITGAQRSGASVLSDVLCIFIMLLAVCLRPSFWIFF